MLKLFYFNNIFESHLQHVLYIWHKMPALYSLGDLLRKLVIIIVYPHITCINDVS